MPSPGVAVTVETLARARPEATFLAIAPIELARIFLGFGPLPAVVGTRDQTGDWDHVGATRIVELAGGSEAREEITAYRAPSYFAYRVSGFSGSLRLLVDHADGAWWFSEAPDEATQVRWTYTFRPRPGRGALVRAIAAPLWQAYARRALALCVEAAERPPERGAAQTGIL